MLDPKTKSKKKTTDKTTKQSSTKITKAPKKKDKTMKKEANATEAIKKKTDKEVIIKKSNTKTIKQKADKKTIIKKAPIPKTLRTKVWNTYISEKIGSTRCYCCSMNKISQLHFECGHVTAESLGGPTNVENLRPICGQCNKSMGIKNMDEFMKECGYDQNNNASLFEDELCNKLNRKRWKNNIMNILNSIDTDNFGDNESKLLETFFVNIQHGFTKDEWISYNNMIVQKLFWVVKVDYSLLSNLILWSCQEIGTETIRISKHNNYINTLIVYLNYCIEREICKYKKDVKLDNLLEMSLLFVYIIPIANESHMEIINETISCIYEKYSYFGIYNKKTKLLIEYYKSYGEYLKYKSDGSEMQKLIRDYEIDDYDNNIYYPSRFCINKNKIPDNNKANEIKNLFNNYLQSKYNKSMQK